MELLANCAYHCGLLSGGVFLHGIFGWSGNVFVPPSSIDLNFDRELPAFKAFSQARLYHPHLFTPSGSQAVNRPSESLQ